MQQIEELKLTYLYLTNKVLPSVAIKLNFPVRLNHCFQRIVLDNLFCCCWYDAIGKSKIPAYKRLDERQLRAAITIAQNIAMKPVEHINDLNQKSLRWRGKA